MAESKLPNAIPSHSDAWTQRIKRRQGPKRKVQVTMDQDLYDALELVGVDMDRSRGGVANVSTTIHLLLKWAVWAHSTGRDPFSEMLHGEPGGFGNWDARIRARREARELEQLYTLDGGKP